MANLQDLTIDDTGFLTIPKGNDSQRPSSAAKGQVRFNTETSEFENFTGSVWQYARLPKLNLEKMSLFLDAQNRKSYPGSGTTWFDISGNGRDSTLSGSPTIPQWNSNGWFSFAGGGEKDGSPTGAYVTLDSTATTTEPTVKPSGVTYQCWMRFTGEQPAGHSIYRGGGTVNHLEWKGSLSDGSWRTEAATDNGYNFGGGSPSYGGHLVDEWFCFTLVFENTGNRNVLWYRDGKLFDIGNMTGGDNPSGEHFEPSSFGRSTGSSNYLYSQSFQGDMSQLIVWDRALNEDEVRSSYLATIRPYYF